jgi:hypothetical protein
VFWGCTTHGFGALPVRRAAAGPSAKAGEYYRPGRWHEYTGYPVRVESSASSHDAAAGRRLWEISETLTGVSYRIFAPSG